MMTMTPTTRPTNSPPVVGKVPAEAGTVFHAGPGCGECKQTGYRGRLGIHELLIVDDDIRGLIMKSSDAATIRRDATSRGMPTLREDGTQKVLEGQTTIEEVMRVTQEDLAVE